MLVMWSASLQAGLFFDRDVYVTSTFWGVTCLIFLLVYLAFGDKKISIQHKSPLVPLLILTGFMLFVYTWHGVNKPLSMKGTGDEMIRWGLFGSVLWIASIVKRGREYGKLLRWVWHTSGMILCGSAFLSIYGLFDVPYGIFRTDDPSISATGARLGGLVQYPNAFGAVMAAMLLERLFALPAALRGRASWLRAAAALLPLAPYTAALLLTESRGAWIAAALACAAGLAADRRFAVPIFAAAAAPILGAALLYRQLAIVQLAPAVLPGLLWLAGLWAGSIFAGLLLCRAAKHSPGSGLPATASSALGHSHSVASAQPHEATPPKRSLISDEKRIDVSAPTEPQSIFNDPAPDTTFTVGSSQYRDYPHNSRFIYSHPVRLITAVVCYFIALLTVFIPVGSRLAGGGKTMSARHLMYKDAWDLFWSAPWLGQGGDTWRLTYRAIQSEPYVGSEVHSGYIDLLLNIGGIGLLIVLTLLFMAAFRIRRNSPRLLPSFLVLLLHSMIDFDWSFGLIWLLLLWHAVMGDENERDEINLHITLLSQPHRTFNLRHVLIISMVGITVWTALAFSYWKGNDAYEQATHSSNMGEREKLLKSAISWNPASVEPVLLLSNQLSTDEAVLLLMNSLNRSPGHPELTWRMAELHAMSGDAVQAARWYRISLNKDKYNATKHTQAVFSLSNIAQKQWNSDREEVAVHTAYVALGIYELYRSRGELLATDVKVRNDRNFQVTQQATLEGERLERMIKYINAQPLVIRQKHL